MINALSFVSAGDHDFIQEILSEPSWQGIDPTGIDLPTMHKIPEKRWQPDEVSRLGSDYHRPKSNYLNYDPENKEAPFSMAAFSISERLITNASYQRYVRYALEQGGRFGLFRFKDDTKKNQITKAPFLLERGSSPKALKPSMQTGIMRAFLLHSACQYYIQEIAPNVEWFAYRQKEQNGPLAVFTRDDGPATDLNLWDAYGFVDYLNRQLGFLRELILLHLVPKQAFTPHDQALLQSGFLFALPTSGQLERVMTMTEAENGPSTYRNRGTQEESGMIKHMFLPIQPDYRPIDTSFSTIPREAQSQTWINTIPIIDPFREGPAEYHDDLVSWYKVRGGRTGFNSIGPGVRAIMNGLCVVLR